MNLQHKFIVGIASGIVLLAVLVGGLFFYKTYRVQKAAYDAYQKTVANYKALKPGATDFVSVGSEFEAILGQYPGVLSKRDESIAKIMLADSLSEVDRKRGTDILKSVARDESYPADKRANAILFIVNDYELDFIDRNFAEREIFSGPVFEDFLREANGNVELAIRKLNEWAIDIFPNEIIGRYRVAKWYAAELYKNPDMPELQRAEFLGQVNRYLAAGDQLLERYRDLIPIQRQGLAYELKARSIYLSGGPISEAEQFFKLAIETYRQPPQSIFQRVYITRSSLYYASFLALSYGRVRADDIRAILKYYYDYLVTQHSPLERNVRLVSFLIAARDSDSIDYPAVDFNNNDLQRLYQFYPELEPVIDSLKLKEYIKGHPLEQQLILP